MGITGQTDRIFNRTSVGWKWFEPGNIFRFSTLNVSGWYLTNFGGTRLSTFLGGFLHGQFLNYMSISIFGGWGPENKSDQVLWGGPLVVSPSGYYTFFNFNTNYQKDLVMGIGYNQSENTEGNLDQSYSLNLTYKYGSQLRLTFSPSYSISKNIVYNNEDYNWYDDSTKVWHYPVPQLEQSIISSGLRIEYTISPTVSLQSFIQPLIWQGKYSDFKEFLTYEAFEFDRYDIDNVHSNYFSLILNSVFRWEFQPGSIFYLVWTRNTELVSSDEEINLFKTFKELLQKTSNNHIALKLSYWIN